MPSRSRVGAPAGGPGSSSPASRRCWQRSGGEYRLDPPRRTSVKWAGLYRERPDDSIEGGAMSRSGITLAVAVAVGGLVLGAGVAVVSGQGEWKAPADAKNRTNPVKGIGSAKKTVETNCAMCHGPGGKGDGPAAAALPPPKPADWTSAAVQSQPDG